jgi:hypothetical protein
MTTVPLRLFFTLYWEWGREWKRYCRRRFVPRFVCTYFDALKRKEIHRSEDHTYVGISVFPKNLYACGQYTYMLGATALRVYDFFLFQNCDLDLLSKATPHSDAKVIFKKGKIFWSVNNFSKCFFVCVIFRREVEKLFESRTRVPLQDC